MVKKSYCKFGCGHKYAPKASANAKQMHEQFCADNPKNKSGGAIVSDDYDECGECGYTKVPKSAGYCPDCGAELDED